MVKNSCGSCERAFFGGCSLFPKSEFHLNGWCKGFLKIDALTEELIKKMTKQEQLELMQNNYDKNHMPTEII